MNTNLKDTIIIIFLLFSGATELCFTQEEGLGTKRTAC